MTSEREMSYVKAKVYVTFCFIYRQSNLVAYFCLFWC